MSAIDAFLAIPEAPVTRERPLFFVEKPDGQKDWTETERRVVFRRLLREQAPSLHRYTNKNEGKANPNMAKLTGVVAGVFDDTIASGVVGPRLVAWCEWKGYREDGSPGVLLPSQVAWGNSMYRAGHPVACFFRPTAAIDWLRGVFPAAFMGGL